MKNLRQFVFAAFVALFAASSTAALFAEADPPSRVARLKYISGQVSMQPGGVNDWAEATVNRPMTTADRLWTDKDSRAELRLGNAAMRMNSETSLTLTNLSDNAVQLELDQGTLNLDVTRLYNGEIYEVDTPNMAFTLTKPGAYRFDVDSQSDTTLVTIWKGKGIATGNGEAVKIDSHKEVRFSDGMSLMHAMYGAPRPDGFDQWCQVRTDREANIASVRYVSPDVVGYEDLDGYGTWREYPTYGRVWVPVVAAGWAPYSVGHWVWIAPWGWTWVDDAPWGFAPFHYGRWVFFSGAWAWAPGPAYVRPVYAPALVAWVGSSGAGIGWFPLGYGEPYIPSYHVSRGYFQSVNISNTRITNITYVTNTYYNVNNVHINIHYVNQSAPGGMTVVNNEVIVNSRQVNHNVFISHDSDWRDHHDRWVTAGPACAPSHDSVLGVHAGERARIPERINQRPVVVKMTPPPRHEPFEPRRGDNGRPWNNDDHRADGHTPNPQHGDNDASNHGYGHGNDADRGHNGYDDGRRDPVADRGRDFPHPGRGHDDDHGQQNANNGHDQDGQNQNAHNGNNDNDDRGRRGRPDWAGVPHEGSSDSPRYPRPPRSSDGDHSQPSSAGNNQPGNSGQQNGNGEQNQNAHNGNGDDNGNNGRRGRPDWAGVPHEGASGSHGPNSSNNDGSQPSSSGNNQPGNSGQNGTAGQNQNAQNGNGNGNDNGNNGRRGRPDWAGVPHEGASGSPNYPRPSSPARPANNDNSQPSSAGNNQPGPSNQSQGSQASDDRDNRGRGSGDGPNWNSRQGQSTNNSNSNNGGQPAQSPAWNRPGQDGNWGNRQVPRPPAQPANNGQGNGMSSGMERPSQPVYQAPAASQQQPDRDVPRPREGVTNRPQPVMQQPQANNQRDYPMPQRQMRQPSYSTPSAPMQQAQRPVQVDRGNSRPAPAAQRASQPQSRPMPSRGPGGNGNSRSASSFQDRDHGKVQDR